MKHRMQGMTSSILTFAITFVCLLGFSSVLQAKIIFHESWEAGCWNAAKKSGSSAGSCAQGHKWMHSQMQGNYSGAAVTSPKPREGKYCMKFEWHRSAATGGNTEEKAMQHWNRQPPNPVERWYGFSVYYPSQYTKPDKQHFVLLQMHGTPDHNLNEPWRNPVSGFGLQNGNLKFWHSCDPARVSPKNTTIRKNNVGYDFGPPAKDRWVDYVVHYIFDFTGNGAIEYWIDGEKKIDKKNMCLGYNDANGHFFSIGIYHPNSKSDHAITKIFVDCLRMGDENSSYEEVAPRGGNPPGDVAENPDPIGQGPDKPAAPADIDYSAPHIKLDFGGGGVEGWHDGSELAAENALQFRFAGVSATDGVSGAAPAEVYQTVVHRGESTEDLAINIPELADGTYTLRFHVADEYGERAIDILAEGAKVVENLDPITEAGGTMKPAVKEADVTIADGNGLQIVLTDDRPEPKDVFLSGLEIMGQGTTPLLRSCTRAPATAISRSTAVRRYSIRGRALRAGARSPSHILISQNGAFMVGEFLR